MISGLRDNALALACLRHGLSAVHGRGMDDLPKEVAARFEGSSHGNSTPPSYRGASKLRLTACSARFDRRMKCSRDVCKQP